MSISEKIETENNLHFRWTKHTFLLANTLVILSIAISWIINFKLSENNASQNPNLKYLPFMIMTPLAIIVWFLGFYFNNKDITIIKASIEKKYFKYYFISNVLFFIFVLISTSLYIFLIMIFPQQISMTIGYIICLSVSGAFGIAVVTLNKYSLYMIEYNIYKKRYGEKK